MLCQLLLPDEMNQLYAEYIMRNAGLEEAQAGIKTAGRNINKLRYAADTTFMAENEEELKSLLMKVKVQFSRSVVSDSLLPHESQQASPPCPSPSPGVHSDTSIELVMPSSHLILCRPLLLLPPIPPSIRVFSNESTLHMRWPNYWNFSFSIIPSKEIPGLTSFRMDWLDLLAVQD